MKKTILILLVFIFLTGCSATYDLKINSNLDVSEDMTFNIDNNYILQNNDSVDLYLKQVVKTYKNNKFYDKFNINYKKGKETSQIIFKNNYNNLNEYAESPILQNIFENVTILKNEEYVYFKTVGEYYVDNIFVPYTPDPGSDGNATIEYSPISVRIKFHNKVLFSNADGFNEKNNIYTWFLKPDVREKYIEFKLSNKIRYDVVISDIISENMIYIIILAIIFMLGIIVYIRFKHTNKI